MGSGVMDGSITSREFLWSTSDYVLVGDESGQVEGKEQVALSADILQL